MLTGVIRVIDYKVEGLNRISFTQYTVQGLDQKGNIVVSHLPPKSIPDHPQTQPPGNIADATVFASWIWCPLALAFSWCLIEKVE